MLKNVTKKIFAGILAISVLGVTGCTNKASNEGKSETKEPITIRFGYQPGHSQIVVAKEKGWLDEEFSKDGITFQLEKFASGPPMIEAFAGERLDFGQVGDQPAIQAKANNIDLKAIGIYSSTEKGNALLATNESGIKSIADLKGKKVGVTIGSVGHQLLYIYLKSAGLTVNDIQQINLSPGDIKTSLSSKNIDAAVTWEPNISQIVQEGSGSIIADGTGYKLNVNVIIGTSKFLKENPEVTERLLKVLDKASKWIKENKQEALEIVSKDAGVPVAALEPGFEKSNLDIAFTDEAIKSIEDTEVFIKENNIIRTDVDVKELIDETYLKNAGIEK